MPGNNLKLADEFASDYDKTVIKNSWNGPVVLYNLCKNYLKPTHSILDLGIGTGESSRLFHEQGLEVTGIDGSERMLEKCREKGIGEKLILHNLETFPYPFKDRQFDIILSNGVFHLIYPLKEVFFEICRIIRRGGIFVFSYENTEDVSESKEVYPGIWNRVTENGVSTYKYSDEYVQKQLEINHFKLLNKERFLTYINKELQKQIFFNAIVAKSE